MVEIPYGFRRIFVVIFFLKLTKPSWRLFFNIWFHGWEWVSSTVVCRILHLVVYMYTSMYFVRRRWQNASHVTTISSRRRKRLLRQIFAVIIIFLQFVCHSIDKSTKRIKTRKSRMKQDTSRSLCYISFLIGLIRVNWEEIGLVDASSKKKVKRLKGITMTNGLCNNNWL